MYHIDFSLSELKQCVNSGTCAPALGACHIVLIAIAIFLTSTRFLTRHYLFLVLVTKTVHLVRVRPYEVCRKNPFLLFGKDDHDFFDRAQL